MLYSRSTNVSTESLSFSHRNIESNLFGLIDDTVELSDNKPAEPKIEGIRVVVSIDFGTTFSGYAYANIYDNEGRDDTEFQYYANNSWIKTNTVLLYDKEFDNVLEWGEKALTEVNDNTSRSVELFKLGLSKIELGLSKLEIGSSELIKNIKLNLPTQLHRIEEQRYVRAITDYLTKM
ncbi:33625_t:CDS:2, partial [Racocetra persica]